jgi:Zonular occludens toxin (Zot)
MGTFAFVGLQGRGKTFWMLYMGIHYAMKYARRLVINFNINLDNLLDYAVSNNYYHLFLMIKNGDIIYVPDNIEYLFSIPNSVILLDEAPLYFGDAASGSKNVAHLVAWLNQMRRNNCDLFLVCQALDRLQKLARDLIDVIIFCDSLCKKGWDGNPEMIQFKCQNFEPVEKFQRWFDSPKRGKMFYDMQQRYAKKSLGFPLGISSYYINFLKIFDSYSNITTDTERIGNWWHHVRIEMIFAKDKSIFISEQKNSIKISDSPEYPIGQLFPWEYATIFSKKPGKYRRKYDIPVWIKNLIKFLISGEQHNDYVSDNVRLALIKKRKYFDWEYPLKLSFFHKGKAGKDKNDPIDVSVYESFYLYEWPIYLSFGYVFASKLSHLISNLLNEASGNILELIKNSVFIDIPVSSKSKFCQDYTLMIFNKKIGHKKVKNL